MHGHLPVHAGVGISGHTPVVQTVVARLSGASMAIPPVVYMYACKVCTCASDVHGQHAS